ncbi:MAG: type II toxin-antitoxin system VapC family toxin [Nanoarchaeota archaeon]|nr:type II toxin-antitoxin system VapC family toxin [Nanoarchaeota archaeon]
MKLYIESSVFNFVFADDSPEKQKITKEFFANKLTNFDVYVSELVFNELNKTKEPKRSALLSLIANFPSKTLQTDKEAADLAEIYVKEKIIPEKFINDALHIAIATVNGIDIVVSWNMEHIVKVKTIVEVNKINLKKGYKQIIIVTPEEI